MTHTLMPYIEIVMTGVKTCEYFVKLKDIVESQALHGDDEYLLLQFDSNATSRIDLEQDIRNYMEWV